MAAGETILKRLETVPGALDQRPMAERSAGLHIPIVDPLARTRSRATSCLREAKREFQRWLVGAGNGAWLLVGPVEQVGDLAEEQRTQEELCVVGVPLQGLDQRVAGALADEGVHDDDGRREARRPPVGGQVNDQRR